MLSYMDGAAVRAYLCFRSIYDRKRFRHIKDNYVRIHRVDLINLWDVFGNDEFYFAAVENLSSSGLLDFRPTIYNYIDVSSMEYPTFRRPLSVSSQENKDISYEDLFDFDFG